MTLSGHSASSPTNVQSASAQVSNGTHLSNGAIIGLAIGASVMCVLLLTYAFLYYRLHRAKSARKRFTVVDDAGATPNALPELDNRDNYRPMARQSAPEIRLVPADEATGTSPSTHPSPRPDDSTGFRIATDASSAIRDLRVNTGSAEFTFGSVKGKGKCRLVNSETPISAGTTLVPSSASPSPPSHWERPFLAHGNPGATGISLRPDSAL